LMLARPSVDPKHREPENQMPQPDPKVSESSNVGELKEEKKMVENPEDEIEDEDREDTEIPAGSPGDGPSEQPVSKPISQHAVECLRRLKGHRAPRGKRKVEFITDPAKRASTFSTLRQTIMRKLGELEVKCDAKILIAFHSHKKHVKTYAYGLNNWSSNKSNFDKVCQQTFYDRPCAPDGQDPLADKARDELRSIYRSLMQRFCQGKNPGYGKPGKCPKWMPAELWIMVDKMKPDQLREAIRKVEEVIKDEHNSKVPRSAPVQPTVNSLRPNVFSSLPGGMNLMSGGRDLHNLGSSMPPPTNIASQMGIHNLHSQRNPHMQMKDGMFSPTHSFLPGGQIQMMKPQHSGQGQSNFGMRPPVPPHVMQAGQGQINPHHQGSMTSGGMTPGQMTPNLASFGPAGKKPQGGQQPRIDLDDSEDLKESFSNQGMLPKQMPMPSPSLTLLSPNFKLQSPATPGFPKNKPGMDFKEWEQDGANKMGQHQDIQHYNSAFSNPHGSQMGGGGQMGSQMGGGAQIGGSQLGNSQMGSGQMGSQMNNPHLGQGFGVQSQQQMMDQRMPQHITQMQMHRMNQGQQQYNPSRGEFKMPLLPGSSSATMSQNSVGMGGMRGMGMHQPGSMMTSYTQSQQELPHSSQHQMAQQSLLNMPQMQKAMDHMGGQRSHDGPPQKKQKI